MSHGNGWFTAQEPRYVGAAVQPAQRVSPRAKRQEAEALADAIEAHRRAGGAYFVLEGTRTISAPRRQLGE
ncbi:MAG TPA: hypothetical protein VM687_16515 [Stenotrophomonas sp.]|nr:hypothetical protein [Stenotrophomonas sp.]